MSKTINSAEQTMIQKLQQQSLLREIDLPDYPSQKQWDEVWREVRSEKQLKRARKHLSIYEFRLLFDIFVKNVCETKS